MKRRFQLLLSFFLSLAFILSILTGCAKKENAKAGPLRICIDTGFHAGHVDYANKEDGAKHLAQMVASHIDDLEAEDIELEIIPKSGTERQTALTRIRTEIMSGEGPDVFLCSTVDTSAYGSAETVLFPFPERAMEDGLFLPLDKYIEHAEYMEWDKMLPAAMEAGKTENGQVILPISFAMPITAYLEGETELPAADTTFADVVASNDPILQSSMAYTGRWEQQFMRCYFPYLFTGIANYKTGELAFTEDDLFQLTRDVAGLKNNEPENLPAHFSDQLTFETYNYFIAGVGVPPARQGINKNDNQVMLPLYNIDGGATALICSFGAVNANTRRPKSAFLVLDYFLSPYMHRNSELYAFFCQNSLPVHMEMGEARDMSTGFIKTSPYKVKYCTSIDSHVFAPYSKAREQISYARFNTVLDQELMKFATSSSGSIVADNEEALRKNVSDTYTKMQRLLDES